MANSFPSAGGGSRPGSYQRRNVDPFAAIRRNHRIKVPQVRVISPEGKQLGVLDTAKAVNLALEVGLDLVEVAPNATPPARISAHPLSPPARALKLSPRQRDGRSARR